MAKGIEARISVLEKAVERLGASLGKVTGTLYGQREKAPRKPRKPRQALGGPVIDPKTGAISADDPRYADAGKKRRGRKVRGEAGTVEGPGAPQPEDAGGEG